MHRAIIIDNEVLGIVTLKTLIENYSKNIKIVASSTDPKKGIGLIEDYKPDIIFIDISIPQLNGFELLEQLHFKDFKLVLISANQEYAIKAIKKKAFDYLLKPIDVEELKTCIATIETALKPVHNAVNNSIHNVELSVRDGIIFIKPYDIIRLEASGSYTVFHLTDNVKHMVSKKLKESEELLTILFSTGATLRTSSTFIR